MFFVCQNIWRLYFIYVAVITLTCFHVAEQRLYSGFPHATISPQGHTDCKTMTGSLGKVNIVLLSFLLSTYPWTVKRYNSQPHHRSPHKPLFLEGRHIFKTIKGIICICYYAMVQNKGQNYIIKELYQGDFKIKLHIERKKYFHPLITCVCLTIYIQFYHPLHPLSGSFF